MSASRDLLLKQVIAYLFLPNSQYWATLVLQISVYLALAPEKRRGTTTRQQFPFCGRVGMTRGGVGEGIVIVVMLMKLCLLLMSLLSVILCVCVCVCVCTCVRMSICVCVRVCSCRSEIFTTTTWHGLWEQLLTKTTTTSSRNTAPKAVYRWNCLHSVCHTPTPHCGVQVEHSPFSHSQRQFMGIFLRTHSLYTNTPNNSTHDGDWCRGSSPLRPV